MSVSSQYACCSQRTFGLLDGLTGTGQPSDQSIADVHPYEESLTLHNALLQVQVPGVRQDILAVGYGQFDFGPPLSGLVALWSLKNPGYPLWSFFTSSGVTAVDFSVQSPNMLAVGLYNGTLAVYDVKTRQVTSRLLLGTFKTDHCCCFEDQV